MVGGAEANRTVVMVKPVFVVMEGDRQNGEKETNK